EGPGPGSWGSCPRAQGAADRKNLVPSAGPGRMAAITLPTALKVAEEELRLPPNVARFALTAGASMNQNGTALFEGVTVLFLAQLFGVPPELSRTGGGDVHLRPRRHRHGRGPGGLAAGDRDGPRDV